MTKLRQVEVLQGQGKSIAAACKEAGLTKQSYYRYWKEYGGLNVGQVRKVKQLMLETGQVKPGQLLFVGFVLLAMAGVMVVVSRPVAGARTLAAYLIGISAIYWLIERLTAFVI